MWSELRAYSKWGCLSNRELGELLTQGMRLPCVLCMQHPRTQPIQSGTNPYSITRVCIPVEGIHLTCLKVRLSTFCRKLKTAFLRSRARLSLTFNLSNLPFFSSCRISSALFLCLHTSILGKHTSPLQATRNIPFISLMVYTSCCFFCK
jgi:hypothetical protein